MNSTTKAITFIESTSSQEVSHFFRCLLFCEGGPLQKDLGMYREEDRIKKWTYVLVSLAMEKIQVSESHG